MILAQVQQFALILESELALQIPHVTIGLPCRHLVVTRHETGRVYQWSISFQHFRLLRESYPEIVLTHPSVSSQQTIGLWRHVLYASTRAPA